MTWRIVLLLASATAVLAACSKNITIGSPGETNPSGPKSVLSQPPISEVDATTFQKEVIDSAQPVLVAFYADWCAPCKRMDPIIDEVANRFQGKVRVIRVNVDTSPLLANRYRVQAIPRFLVFKDGDIVNDILGASDVDRLASSVKRSLI